MWNDLSVSIFPWTEWSWFEFSSRFVAHSYTLKTNSKLWEAKYSWWSACRATRRTGVQFSALSWRNTTWLCMLMTSALRRLRQVAGQASQPSLICKIPARESITKQTNSNNNKKKKTWEGSWGMTLLVNFWPSNTRMHACVCSFPTEKAYTSAHTIYTLTENNKFDQWASGNLSAQVFPIKATIQLSGFRVLWSHKWS